MKNILFLFLILLSQNISAFEISFQNSYFKFSIINVGLSANYSNDNNNYSNFEISILNIGIENKNTGLGIDFDLMGKFWYAEYEGISVYRYTLLNICFFWNMFDINIKNTHNKISFDIITKINIIEMINMNDFIFSAGIRINTYFGRDNQNIYGKFTGLEIGYRNVNKNNNFYFLFNFF